MNWTDERAELVKKLWDEGYSSGAIAAEIGEGCTRNAVIGIIHRKGWHKGAAPAKRLHRGLAVSRPKASAKQPRLNSANIARKAASRAHDQGVAALPVQPLLPSGAGRVRFLDRRPDECAWPDWPDSLDLSHADVSTLRCCGLPVDGPGQPYCPAHRELSKGSGAPSERAAIRDARRRFAA